MQSNKLLKKSVYTIDDFLEMYDRTLNKDLHKIFNLDFQIDKDRSNEKMKLKIEIAKEEDAIEITNIFKEVYNKTYPYKQMEDLEEVRRMILNPEYNWFLFKLDSNHVVGCFAARLEFEKKRGLLFGFAIRKKYQKMSDNLKAFIGCLLYTWKMYKTKILVWYGEVRTNEAAAQFGTSLCGLKPIAFYPNKDLFLNRIESIFLHIIYDKDALNLYRRNEIPKINRQVLNCYSYSNNRFHLGSPEIENPQINLNQKIVSNLKGKIVRRIEEFKFDIKKVKFFIKNTNSYFMFLYNSNIRTIENTEYRVNNLEELFVFLQELKNLIKKLKIRYFQCFISAYEPSHQKLFLNEGFKPRGYVYSWEYNEVYEWFEDRIVFNYCKGIINNNIKLIPESIQLLKFLNSPIENSEDEKYNKEKNSFGKTLNYLQIDKN